MRYGSTISPIHESVGEDGPSPERRPADPRRRRWPVIPICVAAAAFIALAVLFQGTASHSLLDRAKRVPGYTITAGSYPNTWVWVSDRQIQFEDTMTTALRLDIISGAQYQVPLAAPSSIAQTNDAQPSSVQSTMLGLSVPGRMVLFQLADLGKHFPEGVPPDVEITGTGVSPDGKRRAWWVAWGHQSPAWLDRLLGLFRPQPTVSRLPPQTTEAILISDRDGSHMRELGRVKAEYAPDGLGAVSWTPDSKRLCFLYRRGLYILPAD